MAEENFEIYFGKTDGKFAGFDLENSFIMILNLVTTCTKAWKCLIVNEAIITIK